MRLVACAALAAIVGSHGPIASAQQPVMTPEPLQLTLTCENASQFTFRMALTNISNSPTAAIIGDILGNDRSYYVTTLSFIVKRPGAADSEFRYWHPSFTHVGGRIDPWLIALPAGASYSVVVSIPPEFQPRFATPVEVQPRVTTHELGRLNSDVQGLQFIRVWGGHADRLAGVISKCLPLRVAPALEGAFRRWPGRRGHQ